MPSTDSTELTEPIARRLTPRQLAVAQLTAAGRRNREIAEALQMSPNTVKKHLKNIFDVLDVTNRTELAALFVRL